MSMFKSATQLKCVILLSAVLIALAGCSHEPTCASNPELCTKVLFLGNSYTFVNDLPGMFTELAQSGRHPVETGMLAPGGWTLADHVNDTNTQSELGTGEWDYVVLQEQSIMPAIEESRTYYMYPAARTLVTWIRDSGAEPVFFMTWGHRDGAPDFGVKDYETMQGEIILGYLTIADELGAAVAPAGFTWKQILEEYPEINLWQDDGSHPTESGTYLAACVFYATIFQESPEGLKYTAGIAADTAQTLQSVAASVVLADPSHWNIQ